MSFCGTGLALEGTPMLRWEYLLTKAMRARCALAAHYVGDCPAVIDVGCWKNCVALYLPPHVEVLAVDPLLDIPSMPNVRWQTCRLGEADLSALSGKSYGLVALGLDVGTDCAVLEGVASGAMVSVLETSVQYVPGMECLSGMVGSLVRGGHRILADFTLDFTASRGLMPGDGHRPHLVRRMVVLERATG